MTRYEFIENLKSNLSTLNKNIVDDKIKYYNDYIDAEVKKGRSETDVINELGDPRLIAKTIKEVSGEILHQIVLIEGEVDTEHHIIILQVA